MAGCETCNAEFQVTVKVAGRNVTVNTPCNGTKTESGQVVDCVRRDIQGMGAIPKPKTGQCLEDK